MSYRNRIREFKRLPASELLDNAGNWRKHPNAQKRALRGVLQEVGVAGALTAYYSERNGGRLTLIDGHLRKEVIDGDLPVVILDLNDTEADKLLAVFDPLGAMAEADAEKLKSLLATVETESKGLGEMLAELSKAFEVEEWNPEAGTTAPAEFKEYDAAIPVEYCCPKCGYPWSGKPK